MRVAWLGTGDWQGSLSFSIPCFSLEEPDEQQV